MFIIDVKHLKFSYKDKKIFDDVNFSVASNIWNSFYGLSRSGKTTLTNILCGNIKADGYININRKYLCDNTILLVKKEVFLISKETCGYFAGDSLYSELLLSGAPKKNIDEYLKLFKLEEYKDLLVNDLPIDKKIIVSILYSFLINSKIILLDNVLCYLKNADKDMIFNLLKGKTVCNFTSNPEELLYSDSVILMNDNFKVCSVNEISEIKIVDLCLKLKSYDLLDDTYLDMDMVVDKLWKV